MTILKMTDLNINDKNLLLRVDFNVPLKDGKIISDKRIKRTIPTLELAISKGAKIIIISHLGQPKEEFDIKLSLEPIANWLKNYFGQIFSFQRSWLNGIQVDSGKIVLCENIRFIPGEQKNDKTLSQKLASLCDIFVMDAFSVAHRKHASTYGIIEFSKISCIGPTLISELKSLQKLLISPIRPFVAIIGGSKISTKLRLLKNLLNKIDYLLIGGGLANNFIKASGFCIGKSLSEDNLLLETKEIIDIAKNKGVRILIPEDVVVKNINNKKEATIKNIVNIECNDIILDIGPKTCNNFINAINNAKTIIWNGPVGMYENKLYESGTKLLIQSIVNTTNCNSCFSAIGGGDTIAAIEKFNIQDDKISYISTGGGAFLEYLQSGTFPFIKLLNNYDINNNR